MKITDVATVIPRSDGKTHYPAWAILVQISAVGNTTQFIKHLPNGGVITGKNPDKYAVIIPHSGVDSRYLFEQIRYLLPDFYRKHAQGMNLLGSDVEKITLPHFHDWINQQIICNLLKAL